MNTIFQTIFFALAAFSARPEAEALTFFDFEKGSLADTVRIDSTVCDPAFAGADTTTVSADLVVIFQKNFRPDGCPVAVAAASKKISCHAKNDGQIELRAVAGLAPFQIFWTKNGQPFGSATLDSIEKTLRIDSLGPGQFVVSVASANGSATTVGPFIFFDPMPISLIINELSDFNGFAVACPESKNGRARVVAQGAIYPLDVFWSNGAITDETGLLPAGKSSVSVTDALGCRVVDSFFLAAPGKMRFDLFVVGEKCAGASDGRIEIQKIDGGVAPFFVQIDDAPPSAATVFEGLAPGLRVLYIMDANGCEDTIGAVLPAGLQFDFDFALDSAAIFTSDTLRLAVDLPVRADSFLVEPPTGLVFSSKSEAWLAPANSQFYQIVAIDSAGCRAEDSFFLKVKRRREVFFPSAMSRSADLEANRFFRPFFSGGVAEIEAFRIFDRWGELVFEKNNWTPAEHFLGWDGLFRGEAVTNGIFIFELKARLTDGSTKSYSGDFSIFD